VAPPTQPGANSVFDAVLQAAGGRLHANGVSVSDAVQLRRELTEHLREITAGTSLRAFPTLHAAFTFESPERVIEEFFDHDPATVDARAVHRQIEEHVESGKAAAYLAEAIAEPGRWEQATQPIALDVIAHWADLALLEISPDGHTRLHGQPHHPRLAVARLETTATGQPAWAALAPEHDNDPEPFNQVAADTTTTLQPHTQTPTVIAMAELTGQQLQTTAARNLTPGPARTGPGAFHHALIDAAGGALHLDRDTLATTPAHLAQHLTALLLDRPDLLDHTTRQTIERETGLASTEALTDALTDSTHPDHQTIARHLTATYLGLEIELIGGDGTHTTFGTGRPITLVTHTDETGETGWSALTPTTRTTQTGPDANEHSHTVEQVEAERIPTTAWQPETFTLQEPDTLHTQDPWRSASFCTEIEINGQLTRACVSVATLTLDTRPIANGDRS
jgi:hypothetical protein